MDKICSVQMYATVLLLPHSEADARSATKWRHFKYKYNIPVPCLPHEHWCNWYIPLGSPTIILAQATGQSLPIGGATGAAR